MWGTTAIALTLLWKGVFCQGNPLYTLKVSNSITAQRGLCVVIPCTFTYDRSERPDDPLGLWRRNENAKPCEGKPVACSHQRSQLSCREICTETRGRFRLVGNPLNQDCSLRIDDIRDADSGEYYFRYENQPHSPTSKIRFNYNTDTDYLLRIRVQALTDKPEVTLPVGIIEGEEVMVNCTPPGRCSGTPPTIKWGVEFTSAFQEHLYLTKDPNGTASSITFNASRSYHRKHLNCTVHFSTEAGASTTRQVLLEIQYPPLAPQINVSSTDKDAPVRTHNTSVFIREGFDITLLCAADSNPSSNLTWMKGESILSISDPSSNNTLALNISNIKANCNDGVYQCQAINRHGKENSWITVNVQYPPRIPNIDIEMVPASDNPGLRYILSTAHILEGRTFNMRCAVESAPTANLTWTKGGDSILKTSVDKGSLTVTLQKVTPDQDGQYWCVAQNELGAANASLLISVEYEPKLVSTFNTSCQKENNNVTCICVVMAKPPPIIVWNINEVILPETFMNATVHQSSAVDHRARTSLLSLIISEGKRPKVVCQYSNIHGNGSVIMLQPDIDLNGSLLPMIVGVLAGVVLMVAVFLLVWLLIRKGRWLKNDNTSGSDKQEMMDDGTPIYSEIHKAPKSTVAVSNGGAENQPSSGGDATVPTENLYGNLGLEDLQYASIDLSKLKTRNSPIQPTEDTVYADVKVK